MHSTLCCCLQASPRCAERGLRLVLPSHMAAANGLVCATAYKDNSRVCDCGQRSKSTAGSSSVQTLDQHLSAVAGCPVRSAPAHLHAQLVDEDNGAATLVCVGRQLPQCHTHQAGLSTDLQEERARARSSGTHSACIKLCKRKMSGKTSTAMSRRQCCKGCSSRYMPTYMRPLGAPGCTASGRSLKHPEAASLLAGSTNLSCGSRPWRCQRLVALRVLVSICCL